MEKKVNIFIAHTEYHFIQSLNIALGLFNEDLYENYIHITKRGNRFENVIDPALKNNIFVKVHIEKEPSVLVKEILALKTCYRFFFFQENSIYNRFLAYGLKKKHNTIISLGPDGYKPYGVFNKKHEFLSMIKDTITDHKKLYKDRLSTTKLFKSDYYRYGSSSFIDEVWLTNVEIFNSKRNKTTAELKEINPFTLEVIDSLKSYFKLEDNPLDGKEHKILYLNQPFWTEKLVSREMSFLKDLIIHFNKTIYLKLHPGTPEETKALYKKIDQLILIDSKLPAEIYILEVKNSIIFSGWSTALITHNPSCNYYFNLPIYKNCDAKAVDQMELTILPHIDIVETPKSMKFPSE
ncbi:polysialyltransferase family glycosyltransferase [Xanthomarina sp. F1114]|uniref:polysialyltransferase family glycosyltransferase n=1 Tax=Xanthomarina sp. F1114 TaxID=2996019 RepID=UPI00225DEF99|nr:polysialyltransferase family glycosyltransferase [Xanthomarina sp. F1114]MCX7548860.1 polysialyltransferase family glycosyltransferase [Xanthomarina sp. F1114]